MIAHLENPKESTNKLLKLLRLAGLPEKGHIIKINSIFSTLASNRKLNLMRYNLQYL